MTCDDPAVAIVSPAPVAVHNDAQAERASLWLSAQAPPPSFAGAHPTSNKITSHNPGALRLGRGCGIPSQPSGLIADPKKSHSLSKASPHPILGRQLPPRVLVLPPHRPVMIPFHIFGLISYHDDPVKSIPVRIDDDSTKTNFRGGVDANQVQSLDLRCCGPTSPPHRAHTAG
jgi:hypothetical protein